MNYYELNLTFSAMLSEEQCGIYIAFLEDYSFESFQELGRSMLAYIKEEEYIKRKNEIDAYLLSISDKYESAEFKIIKDQNWNKVWESHFEPMYFDNRCTVRAPFHEKSDAEIEIIIMPKMSFGTGHHQTTRMMMESIFSLDVKGKKCLDMGCGTSVLSILAAKLGAESVDAIDIDMWSYKNVLENCEENGVSDKVSVYCGDASLLKDQSYDVIFANINRNILLNDIHNYVKVLAEDGVLVMSGFLEEDVKMLIDKTFEFGLQPLRMLQKDKWCALIFKK
ncbi:MAG: 50S ribosomal protein L11 methyltransferase [Bacteroidetes bacterium]|nr:50S ribosomal protein L11 methyltransferase [Bacteroidota bacterium]